MFHFDEAACLDYFRQMLAIDSTTGQFREIQDWIVKETKRLGFEPQVTHKGGVICSEILLPPRAPPEYADRQSSKDTLCDL